MPQFTRNKFLNVPEMINPKLENYNYHTNKFVEFLDIQLNGAYLIYDGPSDIYRHILDRTVYACSVKCGSRMLKDVFPVMIGSILDYAIRFDFKRNNFFTSKVDPLKFTPCDIGRGFFIINGSLRQLPNFYTTDSTNTHMVRKTLMRVHSYDEFDHGKRLNWYFKDDENNCDKRKNNSYKAGDVIVVHNDGHETLEENPTIQNFFSHCPYPVTLNPYMQKILPWFDIDDLSNLIVWTPGYLFVRLFIKNLYGPLRDGIASQIKSKHTIVVKSIETGNLLHVLSQKTVYFKETKSAGKMTDIPMESTYREIGDNGKIFKEKAVGCYREVPMQTYPLNPYLLQLMVRQTSKKVKYNSLAAFHPSYLGFMCSLGCFETKNIGRTLMSARGTIVSTKGFDALFQDGKKFPLWEYIQISEWEPFFIVVNEACVRVTRNCFETLDLFHIKQRFQEIECFKKDNFIFIRYKVGLLMKKLTDYLWVTPRDEMYWARQIFPDIQTKTQLVEKFGFDYITGYLVDTNPFFIHNAATKTILGFNSLKSAVLATDVTFVRYFMDALSAYVNPKALSHYQPVLPAINDGISDKFVLKVPHVVVTYMSFLGITQEDCIVQRKDFNAFDCIRFYTLRVKFEVSDSNKLTFHPVKGHPDENDTLIGTVVYHGQDDKFILESFSLHAQIKDISSNVKQIHYKKPPFRVSQYYFSKNILSISLEQQHISNTGDKLCSFHGQKGVIRTVQDVPLLDENVRPDIIINPYSLFRMTAGQIIEGIVNGNGQDAKTVRNTNGKLIKKCHPFYAKTFYFPIAYWGNEHMYAPKKCVKDKITNQAVKGRSRGGGMRIGNMEAFNGMRANGIASCFEEKFFKHGDAGGFSYVPKSTQLVIEDAKFFKCNIQYVEEPSVKKIKKWQ